VQKRFVDGETVRGDKLHLFLEGQVIGRDSKKRRRDDSNVPKKVGKPIVYV
jgi:hypothetical protein